MRADLRDCEPLSARVEHVGRERSVEPPCVAQGAFCGECLHFDVLDDRPLDMNKWFGVCRRQYDEEMPGACSRSAALDFVYSHGRHGDDSPETDDCFEEA